MVLHRAFAQKMQFGKDIVFTYGPWGFVETRTYFPDTFGIMLLAWALIATALWFGCWTVARSLGFGPTVAMFWVALLVGLTNTAEFVGFPESGVAFLLPSVLLIIHFHTRGGRSKLAQLLLVVALSLESLCKFTYFAIAVGVITVVVAHDVLQKRFPWSGVVYVLSLTAWWLLAGQNLLNFSEYLRSSLSIATGFTDAMSTGHLQLMPLTFLLCAAIFGVVTVVACWRDLHIRTVFPAFGLTFLIWMLFKAAYVRDDGIHNLNAVFGFLAVVVLYCLVPVSAAPRSRRVGVCCLIVLPATLLAGFTFNRSGGPRASRLMAAATAAPRNLLGAAQWLRGRSSIPGEQSARMDFLKKLDSVSPLRGTVDVYPTDISVAFANGFSYSPRPVFQSYSVYTPRLNELNVQHLMSERAADWILFNVAPIDHRLPALEEGASWPVLMTRYDVTGSGSRFLILRRASLSRSFVLSPLERVVGRWGDPIIVPSNDGMIWAKIDVRKSPLGQIESFLYKSALLHIRIRTIAGSDEEYRFIPTMAENGFLLSPLIRDRESFATLASHHWRETLSSDCVVSITIDADENPWGRRGFSSDINVDLFELQFPPQNPLKQ